MKLTTMGCSSKFGAHRFVIFLYTDLKSVKTLNQLNRNNIYPKEWKDLNELIWIYSDDLLIGQGIELGLESRQGLGEADPLGEG